MNRPQRFTRILSCFGLALLVVALAGAMALVTGSFPRKTLKASIHREELSPPDLTPMPVPYLVVSDETVNLYDGPGQDYRIQKTVIQRDVLPILGRSADGKWLNVEYLGWNWWIAVQSVSTDANIQALPVIEAPPTPVNHPPSIHSILPAAETVQAWGVTTVTCQVSDIDDDVLTYIWEASDGFITGEGESVTYNAPGIIGSQTITVVVRDEHGSETEYSVQVQIVPATTPPGMSEPGGVFGQIWYESLEARRKLGWATGEGTTSAAQQSFERGVMFLRKDTDEIYVLKQGGSWQIHIDTWEEGMDEYSCPDVAQRQTPPTPVRGFGKVWCEQLGGPYADIGWAVNDEQAYDAHWQSFERGLMWQGRNGCIYVLYEDDAWQTYLYPFNGGTSKPPSPTEASLPPAPTPTCTPLSNRMIEAEWPGRMEIDRSDCIRVSVVRAIVEEPALTIEMAGHTVVAATSLPVGGTPEVPIEEAFGPAYKALVSARLEGTAFEIIALQTEYRSLDQDRITWDWNILPLKPGYQIINVCINVQWQPSEHDRDAIELLAEQLQHVRDQWQPSEHDRDAIERTIWRAPLEITVKEPWMKTGQLSIVTQISSLLGLTLSVPWLYQRMRQREEKRRIGLNRSKLRQILAGYFNREDLRTLCFDLEIEYENLPDMLDGMTRELVAYCERHERIPELIEACYRLRPGISWQDIVPASLLEKLERPTSDKLE